MFRLYVLFQDKLLSKLEESEPDPPTSQEDECVICINARATMQTSPCGHRVVCRRCFVKTIQSAVAQRLLPLRCVICRARVNRLTSSSGTWRIQESASSYSMGAKSWASVGVSAGGVAPSASSYSMNDAHSGHHAFHMPARFPRSPTTRVSQSDSLYSMSSTGSSSATSVFSKTSSISSELCSPASPISPTAACAYAQTTTSTHSTTLILNNHLAPPTPSLSPHSPSSTSGSSTSASSLSPKENYSHSHHSGCPSGCSGAIPRKPLKSSSTSSSSGSCSSSSNGHIQHNFIAATTHTYPGRRHNKGRLMDLQNRLPPIKEFRSPAKVPHPSPVHISNPRFRYASYTKSLSGSNNKEPSSPPKRPMNIHISASLNTLDPPPLKAGGSKISPLLGKHPIPKTAYNSGKDRRVSSSLITTTSISNNNSCPVVGNNDNNKTLTMAIKTIQPKSTVQAALTAKSNITTTTNTGVSTKNQPTHHSPVATLTAAFTSTKSFPLFCNNNNNNSNHKEKAENKKNETMERRKEEKLKLKAEKEARKEEKRLAKEEERIAKMIAKEEKKKTKKEAKELLLAHDVNGKRHKEYQ
uniref:RING-type domain-containing protein n=1 Tax=Glossina brevipalpis TaxID=37001 RepID=A0A1A9WK49_9MUSC